MPLNTLSAMVDQLPYAVFRKGVRLPATGLHPVAGGLTPFRETSKRPHGPRGSAERGGGDRCNWALLSLPSLEGAGIIVMGLLRFLIRCGVPAVGGPGGRLAEFAGGAGNAAFGIAARSRLIERDLL